ncbi:uncharacterized protein LOC107778200 [Nicotiana tabacum]|uniref:Uncharacterized protein LOC107778200 n=1 Tax=Nicotiana tabacum TaxID=4097 RepID=A0A1S3YPJ1_TOBAC|nr:uncharacterized protein T28D9.1-like [Nicotiana tomentosiformis]XP_016453900.1 PREDICTED: uncharacterized protein T28D9.1-like [Nicotiana tabacum]
MGNFFSTLSDTNPSSPNSTTTMSSSTESSPTHESKSDLEPTHKSKSEIEPIRQPETAETQNSKEEINTETQEENGEKDKDTNLEEEEEEEEEEGECGFCLFMKGGGCKDTFTEWEKCIEEGEKNKEDIVDKCFEVTSALKKCMEAHSDYYAPILQAEKAAEAELNKELDKEKEQGNGGDASGSVSMDPTLDGNSNNS